MAIVIKKRNAGDVRAPAPLVEPKTPKAEVVAPAPPVQKYPPPRLCTFCEHAYVFPCDGKSETCMNRRWREARMAGNA